MSNTGHRGYLWDLPLNGLGVGWLAEVDMRLLWMSFWPPPGRGDDIYGPKLSVAAWLWDVPSFIVFSK